MADNGDTERNRPKRNEALNSVLSCVILFASLVSGTIPGKTKTDDDIENTNRQIAYWTRVVGRWTRGLVGVGVLTIAAIGWQACILSGQLNESRLDRRAWLAPKNIEYPEDLEMHQDGPFDPVTISFNFTNTGKEPARFVSRLIGHKFLESSPWDREIVSSKIREILHDHACKDFDSDPSGDTVFPKDDQRISFVLNKDESGLMLKGGKWLMVGGCLVYRTIEGVHWTQVCRFLDPIDPKVTPNQKGFRTAICPTHNQAD